MLIRGVRALGIDDHVEYKPARVTLLSQFLI